MKKQKIGGGEHACIRDDDELIHAPEYSEYDMLMPLVDLTYKTRDTFAIHDFTKASANTPITRDEPLIGKAKGLQLIQLFSTAPIKDGDVVVTEKDGVKSARMVFDVQAGVKMKSFYTMNAVRHVPDLGIGHPAPNV